MTQQNLSSLEEKEKITLNKKDLHTISLLVANKPGVLVRIALVFSRRGYNIDSLVVSVTNDPQYSRMTITAKGDPTTLDQIIKQTSKLIDVLHISEHRHEDALERELALVKIRFKPASKAAVTKTLKGFQTSILETTVNTMIIEQTGSTDELNQLEEALKKFGIIELVRTGKVVMARGREET